MLGMHLTHVKKVVLPGMPNMVAPRDQIALMPIAENHRLIDWAGFNVCSNTI